MKIPQGSVGWGLVEWKWVMREKLKPRRGDLSLGDGDWQGSGPESLQEASERFLY